MSDVEGKILKMYDKSKPKDEDLYDVSPVIHWSWGLVALLVGVVIWLCIALVNAENQRYAMATGKCQDPVFPGTVDQRCLLTVHSRDHWWQHLWYAGTHILPSEEAAWNHPRRKPGAAS